MARNIRFLTSPCSLGHVLIAAGERGVCHLRLGDDPDELARRFRASMPDARPADLDDPVRAWSEAIVAQIENWGGQGTPPKIPLCLRGTEFQQRVWKSLRQIPMGEVRSYSEVAREIGKPRAVRAVASACARNPVALLVPCHRVVPKTGGSGSYRWGAERKRALLGMEGRAETQADHDPEPAIVLAGKSARTPGR
jgi:AraC family transcriptional regulator of adaptative response/methylated-DNA-[protein]-cysteine methyltransferase